MGVMIMHAAGIPPQGMGWIMKKPPYVHTQLGVLTPYQCGSIMRQCALHGILPNRMSRLAKKSQLRLARLQAQHSIAQHSTKQYSTVQSRATVHNSHSTCLLDTEGSTTTYAAFACRPVSDSPAFRNLHD